MGFNRFDSKMVIGDHLHFEDKGYISKGATTRKYSAINRYTNSLIGYIKFYAQWRQYTFFPLNCVLNKDCLREIADFCVEATTAHREHREPFPASVKESTKDSAEKTVVEGQP